MKIVLTIKINYKNKSINEIINEFIDLSLLFNVNLEFNIIKNNKYSQEKVAIFPIFISNKNELIPENYRDFHCCYLEDYIYKENIDIAVLEMI